MKKLFLLFVFLSVLQSNKVAASLPTDTSPQSAGTEKSIQNISVDKGQIEGLNLTTSDSLLSHLNAVEIPQLNLEVGRNYTFETITHIDTTAQDSWRYWNECKWIFTPLSFDKTNKTYRVKATLEYLLTVNQKKTENNGWVEEGVYETGYLLGYRAPMIYLNYYKIPVFFRLSQKGVVDSLDFRSYENYYTPEGYRLSLDESVETNLKKEFQMIFFIENPSLLPKKDSWSYLFALSLPSRNGYVITDVSPNTISLDISFPKEKKNNIPWLFNYYKQHVILDRQTGIIVQQNLDFIYRGMTDRREDALHQSKYYSKFIPEFNSNKPLRIFSQGEWRDTIFENANTKISIKLENRIKKADSVDISIALTDLTFRIPINANREIEAYIPIEKPTTFNVEYPGMDYRKISDFDEFETAYTKSAYSFTASPGEELKLTLSTKDYLHNTSEYRDNGDPRRNLSQMLPMPKLISDPDWFNNDNYIINNTLLESSYAYLNFLKNYFSNVLPQKITEITGVSKFSKKEQAENIYYLANTALAEPLRSHFLAYYISEAIEYESWEIAHPLYQSFKRDYADKPVFPTVEKKYERYAKTAPGAVAPDFSMKDIFGNIYALSDFRGKVVILQFLLAGKDFKIFDSFTKEFLGDCGNPTDSLSKEVIYLNIVHGQTEDLIERVNQGDYRGYYFCDDNFPFSKVSYDYQVLKNTIGSGPSYLIDKNGVIVQKSRQKIADMDIQKALAIPYQKSFSSLPLWIRITLIALPVALIAVAISFLLYQNILRRKLNKSNLARRMRELELTAIRAQMNPHFMYNCLNSIQNLVQKNKNEEAHLYLSKFANLIRQVLNTSKKEEISLSEELGTLKEYIDLEKLRFDFDYEVDIGPNVDPFSLFVPPMILQPIVENALLHGLLPKPDNRKLSLAIRHEKNNICITVEDNGVGRSAYFTDHPKGNGKGLELTRERLRLMAERQATNDTIEVHDLTDTENRPCGTRVIICLEEE